MNYALIVMLAVVGAVAVGKVVYLIHQRRTTPVVNRSVTSTALTPARINTTETGPMIYYASKRYGLSDNEYRFNYKKVNGSWRAYILKTPSFGNRDTGGVVTHRLYDGNSPYVCWDRPVQTLKDMQTISRFWADSIQKYIATGQRFG